MTAFLLLHSPLIGPYTWSRVADQLEARGHITVVPDLSDAIRSGRPAWEAAVELATEVARKAGVACPIVAGHSGAGALVPPTGASLGGAAGYLFADAVLPQAGGTHLANLHPSLRNRLEGQAADGMVPPWNEWWGEPAMAALIPDDEVRGRFVSELEPVPASVFDEVVDEVPGWPDAPCGYLRLSEAYELEEADAARRGWLVSHVKGTHLSVVSEPERVAGALLKLLGRLGVDG